MTEISERARKLDAEIIGLTSGCPHGKGKRTACSSCRLLRIQMALDAERAEAEQRERERWAVEFLLAASRMAARLRENR